MPRGEHLTRLIFFIKHPPDRQRGGRAGAGAGGGGSAVASSEVLRNQKVSSGWWEMEKVMPLARPCRGRQNITGEWRERRGARVPAKAKKIAAIAAKPSGMNFRRAEVN